MTDLNTQINCISLECGTNPIFEKRHDHDCNASLPPLCSNTTLGKNNGFIYVYNELYGPTCNNYTISLLNV